MVGLNHSCTGPWTMYTASRTSFSWPFYIQNMSIEHFFFYFCVVWLFSPFSPGSIFQGGVMGCGLIQVQPYVCEVSLLSLIFPCLFLLGWANGLWSHIGAVLYWCGVASHSSLGSLSQAGVMGCSLLLVCWRDALWSYIGVVWLFSPLLLVLFLSGWSDKLLSRIGAALYWCSVASLIFP